MMECTRASCAPTAKSINDGKSAALTSQNVSTLERRSPSINESQSFRFGTHEIVEEEPMYHNEEPVYRYEEPSQMCSQSLQEPQEYGRELGSMNDIPEAGSSAPWWKFQTNFQKLNKEKATKMLQSVDADIAALQSVPNLVSGEDLKTTRDTLYSQIWDNARDEKVFCIPKLKDHKADKFRKEFEHEMQITRKSIQSAFGTDYDGIWHGAAVTGPEAERATSAAFKAIWNLRQRYQRLLEKSAQLHHLLESM